MNLIKEDYVSFETAKLLNEKEFDKDVDNRFSPHFAYNEAGEFSGPSWDTKYNAPTLQMVMKWLREKYNIIIIIEPHMLSVEELKVNKFTFSIWVEDNYTEPYFDDEEYRGKDFSGYEKTCDVAIRYCLNKIV